MPFLIQFISAAIFGVVGFLAGGMITVQIGDEQFDTALLLMMVGVLVGFFIVQGLLPLFEHPNETDQPQNAKHSLK